MGDSVVVMGLVSELDMAGEALDRLRELGVSDEDISVVSGMPYSAEALGRPHVRSRAPAVALAGAGLGALLGLFLTVVTPRLYTLQVGGQAVVPGPPTAVLMYESIMLCLVLGAFVGMVILSRESAQEQALYTPAISDGKIGVALRCEPAQEEAVRAALVAAGAEIVEQTERRAP
jgi:hypothetical protein